MAFFRCHRCQTLDDTTLAYPDGTPVAPLQCTVCRTGVWHGVFSQETYDPTKHRDLINLPPESGQLGSSVD